MSGARCAAVGEESTTDKPGRRRFRDVSIFNTFSVGLLETAGGASPATPLRIPATGRAPLGVPADEMVIEFTFVPITINGVTPVLTGQNLQDLIDGYYDWNPVHDIKTTMHAPVTITSKTIDAVLTKTSQLRAAESASSKMLYIGLDGPRHAARVQRYRGRHHAEAAATS